jgi:long-chain acyl-CoA synthetase
MYPSLLHSWPLHRYADKTAVVFEDQRLTYRRIDARINRLSHGILSLGLRPGNKMGILLNNSLESVETLFGIPRAGLAVVPLNARHSPAENAYILKDSEADAVIVGRDLWERLSPVLAEIPRLNHVIVAGGGIEGGRDYAELCDGRPETPPDIQVRPDDIERIHYTSGTTGRPKGAVSTFQISYNRLTNTLINLDQPISPADVNLNIGPLTHAAGLMMSTYYARGAVNIIMSSFDPAEVLRTIEKEKVTSLLMVPTMIVMLLMTPDLKSYDLSSVKRVWYGTAPMSPDRLRQAIDVFGPVFRQNYGLTESPQPVTYLAPEDHIVEGTAAEMKRLASAGKPALGVALKIVDEQGKEVETGQIGEIIIHNQQLMKEYWKLPEATAEAFRGGWFHTGDMATKDEHGYIYIVDRKNDMIISGGFNIYPREVEEALMTHPGVASAAVVGVPDDVWGEAVKAFVVPRPGSRIDEAELIDHCKSTIAGYKKPKSVEVVAELPLNAYGKIMRRLLKEPYWKGRQRRI